MMLRSGSILPEQIDNESQHSEHERDSVEGDLEVRSQASEAQHSDMSLASETHHNNMLEQIMRMLNENKQDNIVLIKNLSDKIDKVDNNSIELRKDLSDKIDSKVDSLNDSLSKQLEETKSRLENSLEEVQCKCKSLDTKITQIQEDFSNSISILENKFEQKLEHKLTELENKVSVQIYSVVDNQNSVRQEWSEFKHQLSDQITETKEVCDSNFRELKTEQTNLILVHNNNVEKITNLENNLKGIQSNINNEIANKLSNLQLNNSLVSNNNLGYNIPQVRPSKIPSFNGKCLDPVAELNKIITYIDSTQKDFHKNGSWNTVASLLSTCFTESAYHWIQTILPEIDNWESFYKNFLAVYWNESKQMRIRMILLNGKYNSKGKDSLIEYFQNKYSLAKNAFPTLSQSELITLISKHYPDQIQNAVLIQNINSYNKFLTILQSFTDMQNSRNENSHTNNDSLNRFNQNHNNYTDRNSFRQNRPRVNNDSNQQGNSRFRPYSNNFRNNQTSNYANNSFNRNNNQNFNRNFNNQGNQNNRPRFDNRQFTPDNRNRYSNRSNQPNSNNHQTVNAIQVSNDQIEVPNNNDQIENNPSNDLPLNSSSL